MWSRKPAAPKISASGSVARTAPVHVGLPRLATTTAVTTSLGEALDDVTFATIGTQQHLWGSSYATSECGLTTTLLGNAALDAVNS